MSYTYVIPEHCLWRRTSIHDSFFLCLACLGPPASPGRCISTLCWLSWSPRWWQHWSHPQWHRHSYKSVIKHFIIRCDSICRIVHVCVCVFMFWLLMSNLWNNFIWWPKSQVPCHMSHVPSPKSQVPVAWQLLTVFYILRQMALPPNCQPPQLSYHSLMSIHPSVGCQRLFSMTRDQIFFGWVCVFCSILGPPMSCSCPHCHYSPLHRLWIHSLNAEICIRAVTAGCIQWGCCLVRNIQLWFLTILQLLV